MTTKYIRMFEQFLNEENNRARGAKPARKGSKAYKKAVAAAKRINEKESFRGYDWTFGEDDIDEYEGALACAREVEHFLGKGLEILLADWDHDYDSVMGEVDPLGDIILSAFDSSSGNFHQVKMLEWEGDSNNFYSTFVLYQHENLDLRVVIEKGDRGWNWGPYNHDLFANVLVSQRDYEFLSEMREIDPRLISKYFQSDDEQEFLKDNNLHVKRAARR